MEETPSTNSDDLFRAVVSGDLANVRSLLLNTLNSWGKVQLLRGIGTHDGIAMTTLDATIRYNRLEVLREMLKGINQEHRELLFSAGTDSNTSFKLAAEYCSNAEIILTMQETLESAQMMRLMCVITEEKITPVHIAARRSNSLDIMKALLNWSQMHQKMELLKMMDGKGRTPIHIAAQRSADIMEAILETLDMERRMTLLSMKDKEAWTPVHLAAQHSSADAMKTMFETLDMEHKMKLLSMKQKDEWTPVHIAAQHSADVMQAMLETLDMEHRMTLLSMKDKEAWTPVLVAAQQSADVLEAILETLDMEHRMTLLSMKDKEAWTPVHLAAQHSADAMKTMFETLDMEHKMTLLSMKQKDAWTPIHIAAQHSEYALKAMLEPLDTENRMTLLSKKDIKEWTPVHVAAQFGDDVMRAMLDALDMEHRMTLLSMKAKGAWAPVHVAAQHSADAMKTMFETLDMEHKMTLLSMKQKDEWTPVHIAAQHSADVMQAMLETLDMEHRMTLLSMKDKEAWTPVLVAAQQSADVLEAILETLDMEHRMTLLSMKDKEAWTPVHLAAQHSADALKVMLGSIGIEHRMTLLGMKNKNECTPVHTASQHNPGAAISMLEGFNQEQILSFLLDKELNGYTPVHLLVNNSQNTDAVAAMLGQLATEVKFSLLSETNITGKNAVNHSNFLCLIKAFENEDIIAKIRLLNLNYKSGVSVLHGLVAEKNSFAASSFLSWPSESIDIIFVILLLVAVKTGNVATDCDMIYCLPKHDTALQLNSPCMAHLFHYMTTASHAALSAVLEQLATNHLIERKHHILLWKDRQNNNFLHLAATVNHIQFIRKILYTQDTHQIREALQDKNIDGLKPCDVTTGPETRRLLAWSESQHEYYPLVAPPRVVVFYTSQDRPGAGAELNSIVSALTKLNIVPQVRENPTERDIYDIIRDNQNVEESALIVVVMSHGDKGTVAVRDRQLPVNDILMQMKTAIPEGNPKILILQACQGRLPSENWVDSRTADSGQKDGMCLPVDADLDSVTQGETAALDSKIEQETDAKGSNSTCDHYDLPGADMAVLAATINKYTANRNLFIPLLAKHIESSGSDVDLIEVFRRTTEELRRDVNTQVPEIRSTMNYKLCLKNIYDNLPHDT